MDEATLRQYGEGIQVAMDPNDEDDDEGLFPSGHSKVRSDGWQTFRVR